MSWRVLPLLIPLLLAVPTPAAADLVDRVVAVVDDQLVLDSEVRLEKELSSLDTTASAFWARGRSTPLERLIDAAAIRVAASSVVLYQPPDDDVRARLEAVRAEFTDRPSWSAFLERHGLTEDGLLVLLRRRMVVERFLARNIQTPVEDRQAWLAATEALVGELRKRMKVRTIPKERR